MTLAAIEAALNKMKVRYIDCVDAETGKAGILVRDKDGIAGGVRFERFMGSLPMDAWSATGTGIFFKPDA